MVKWKKFGVVICGSSSGKIRSNKSVKGLFLVPGQSRDQREEEVLRSGDTKIRGYKKKC